MRAAGVMRGIQSRERAGALLISGHKKGGRVRARMMEEQSVASYDIHPQVAAWLDVDSLGRLSQVCSWWAYVCFHVPGFASHQHHWAQLLASADTDFEEDTCSCGCGAINDMYCEYEMARLDRLDR